MTAETVAALNEISAGWMPLLLRASWQGGVALLTILAVCRVTHRIPAGIQCWLWRLAFFKLLIAALWIPSVELRWLPPDPLPVAEYAPVVTQSAGQDIPKAVERVTLSSSPRDERLTPHTESPLQLSWRSWLLIAWLAGLTLLLANLLRQWLQVKTMTSRLKTLTDQQTIDRVSEHCQLMDVRRQPQIRLSDRSLSPCLTGILRPFIVLPADLLEPSSEDELNAALLHELAHIKRRDLLWNWLPALAEVVFFFHPLVWMAKREWQLAQEIATDERVVSVSGMSLLKYADSLVDLAARGSSVAISPNLVVAASDAYSQLSRRVIAMQTFRSGTPHRRFLITVALLFIALLNIAPVRLTAQEQESPAGRTSSQPVNGPEGESGRPTLSELIAGLRAAEQNVHCLAMEYALESRDYFTKPGEVLPENILKQGLISDDAAAGLWRSHEAIVETTEGQYRSESTNVSTQHLFDRSKPNQRCVQTSAFDGRKVRTIFLQIATDGTVTRLAKEKDQQRLPTLHPFAVIFHEGGIPISEVLRSRRGRVVNQVSSGEETVCVVETSSLPHDDTFRLRFFIDPTRNFAVVRRQTLQRQNDNGKWVVKYQVDCSDHEQVQAGVWLPTKVRTIQFHYSDKDYSSLVAKAATTTLSVTNWRVNDTPDADHFQLEIEGLAWFRQLRK